MASNYYGEDSNVARIHLSEGEVSVDRRLSILIYYSALELGIGINLC